MRKVSDLDLGVSDRQAIGATQSYSKSQNLSEIIEKYWEGKLVLPPHPDWEGDFTDWAANPFNDRNWQFQHHTLRWLNPLRWAALGGDQKAKEEWRRTAFSWAEANVPAEKSQSRFAWVDMADGNRAIQLSLGAPLVESGDDWFVRLLEYHRDWLMDESHIAKRNHGLHQHAGLLVVGAALRDEAAKQTAVSRMIAQYETAFDRQGANDEGSTAYHQMNMQWWLQAWERARLEGLEPPGHISERLARAAHVLAHMSLPNGQLPQIGDASRGRVSTGFSEATDYVATGGKSGAPPEELALILDRGYIFSRSGWGENRPLESESHMVVRYGEELRSHSHRDRGSLHIYSRGQRWLIDSGFHSYGASLPENKYLKSRDAHSVPFLVGHAHDDDAPVELVSQSVTDQAHAFSLVDRGYPDSPLTRRVIYVVEADCWIVFDRAETPGGVKLAHQWFVEPGLSVRHIDNGFRLSNGVTQFGMYWLGRAPQLKLQKAAEGDLRGWVGVRWRTLEPGARISAVASDGRDHLVTLFGAHEPKPLSIIDSHVAVRGVILLHLARGDSSWRVHIEDDTVMVVPSQ